MFHSLFPPGGLNETPYRLLFPLGLAGLLYGMIRMLLPFSPENVYWHREAMIGLYLLPVGAGFLFTAVPRFFASGLTRNIEVSLVLVIAAGMYGTSLMGQPEAFAALETLLVLTVLVFVAERFFRRQSGIPLFTPFLLVGLFSGLMGALSRWMSFYDASPLWANLARSLFLHGMFWTLFLGVGSKFFPVITMCSRGARPLSHYERFVFSSHLFWTAMALLLWATFIAEGLGWIRVAMAVRALVVLFLAKEGWLLFRKSPRGGVFNFFLKLGLWSVLLAHFVFPFYPEQRVHLYHAVFVGGFLLGSLIVMGRVSLAHERLDLDAEVKSKWAAVAFGLIYLAAWTRASAHLTRGYVLHLRSAAVLVVLAVALLAGLYLSLWRRAARIRKVTNPIR